MGGGQGGGGAEVRAVALSDGSPSQLDSWGVARVAHGNAVDYHRGVSKRDAELLAIQSQSGWRITDSPAVKLPEPTPSGKREDPVLTGNAWHWGRGLCPSDCAANEGVCLPDLGRCDCRPFMKGQRCWQPPPKVRKVDHNLIAGISTLWSAFLVCWWSILIYCLY